MSTDTKIFGGGYSVCSASYVDSSRSDVKPVRPRKNPTVRAKFAWEEFWKKQLSLVFWGIFSVVNRIYLRWHFSSGQFLDTKCFSFSLFETTWKSLFRLRDLIYSPNLRLWYSCCNKRMAYSLVEAWLAIFNSLEESLYGLQRTDFRRQKLGMALLEARRSHWGSVRWSENLRPR